MYDNYLNKYKPSEIIRNSLVSRVTGCALDSRGLIPERSRIFLVGTTYKPALESTQASTRTAQLKRQKCEAVDVKNVWKYTSISPHVFMASCLGTAAVLSVSLNFQNIDILFDEPVHFKQGTMSKTFADVRTHSLTVIQKTRRLIQF